MKYLLFSLLICFSLNAQSSTQIKNQIKNSGLSPEQVKKMANDRGLSSQILQLESDVTTKNNDDQTVVSNDKNEIFVEEQISNESDQDEINTEAVNNPGSSVLNYFGYNIFTGNPDAFQSSSFGVVDPNYNIGPGDQIIVMLWGESQFRQEFSINREGFVFIPEVGQVFVNGLNLEDLEKKLFQIFSKVYSTLNPISGKPTTFIDVSIGDLRPLRVIVLGEVAQPGAYSVSPSTSLSSSLYYFNGPTNYGSLRDIRLIRNGKIIGKIDFYDYLLSGKMPNDLRLQMDDIVFIPKRGKTVTIDGEINRSGIYELNEIEGLNQLIEIAGGLSVNAYTNRVQINRIVPKDQRSAMGMDRMLIDIELDSVINNSKKINLLDGDIIQIFPIEEIQKNYVTINSSSVMRPGRYQLKLGMKVMDLINEADGLLNSVYFDQAHILRINNDLTNELISINLKYAMNGDVEHNIDLQFMDQLIIYNNHSINNTFGSVFINGPIKSPGRYDLETGQRFIDLILKTGGFKENVKKVRISIARQNPDSFNPTIFDFPIHSNDKDSYYNVSEINNEKNRINQFLLESNDIINIYSDPKSNLSDIVTIDGAVFFPGSYPIVNQYEKVTDIINRAGGLLPNAYPEASRFIRSGQPINLSFEEIIKNPKSSKNFVIMNNDRIIINSRSNIINIIGEVNQPGSYKFYKGYNLKRYLSIAGGLNNDADKNQIWVTYPNGISKHYNKYLFSPTIFDGSIITVGAKPESEPLDKTEFAKEIASIISDFLQIALTLVLLNSSINNNS